MSETREAYEYRGNVGGHADVGPVMPTRKEAVAAYLESWDASILKSREEYGITEEVLELEHAIDLPEPSNRLNPKYDNDILHSGLDWSVKDILQGMRDRSISIVARMETCVDHMVTQDYNRRLADLEQRVISYQNELRMETSKLRNTLYAEHDISEGESMTGVLERVARLEARLDHRDAAPNMDSQPVGIAGADIEAGMLCTWDGKVLMPMDAKTMKPQQPVAGNSREYYEQQIEEISAKWQKAEEWAKICEARCAIIDKRCDEAVDTISDLREKIGSRDAIISQKNRELEIARSRTTWASQCTLEEYTQMEENAKLGALVRQMPKGKSLKRQNLDTEYWICDDIGRGFPEEVLEALKEKSNG